LPDLVEWNTNAHYTTCILLNVDGGDGLRRHDRLIWSAPVGGWRAVIEVGQVP
jgi:hypothetical protein